jgi:hypothetical protein
VLPVGLRLSEGFEQVVVLEKAFYVLMEDIAVRDILRGHEQHPDALLAEELLEGEVGLGVLVLLKISNSMVCTSLQMPIAVRIGLRQAIAAECGWPALTGTS